MPALRSTGRSWTPTTLNILFEMTRQGRSQREIAQRLRRAPKAIERKTAEIRQAVSSMSFSKFVQILHPMLFTD